MKAINGRPSLASTSCFAVLILIVAMDHPHADGPSPFSSRGLMSVAATDLPPAKTIQASDGLNLAVRAYVPEAPRAVLVFWHGGGAHSGAGYHHLGNGLMTDHRIAVYMPDMRGHGVSQGERGDAAAPKQIWQDISTVIDHTRARHDGLPIFVGGHSSGGGLALNYASWDRSIEPAGWVFLSPELGFRSGTERANRVSFASVEVWPFVVNAITGGLLFGHYRAVKLNYPDELVRADPALIASYTVNVANAVTPQKPEQQFRDLAEPFGLWVGEDDELFAPERVVAFAELSGTPEQHRTSEIIAAAKHLSIPLTAHEFIGPWLIARVRDIERPSPK